MMKYTQQTGLLIQCIGGFYYVEAADTVYTCKARGAFRNRGLTPMVGDRVLFTLHEDGNGTVDEVLPRRNFLVRPLIANIDCMVLVVAAAEPAPHLQIVDTMIAIAEQRSIEPVLVVNKTDLADGEEIAKIYRDAGFSCFTVCANQPDTLQPLRKYLYGKVSAFTGNSGVGKSSILNALDPRLCLETGEISKKLGRGRHTTRSATLYPFVDGYLVDTPGFSSLDIHMLEDNLHCDQLFFCFREFDQYFQQCRFSSCTHTGEPGCALQKAVKDGKISPSRYDSYCALYQQLKNKKDWE